MARLGYLIPTREAVMEGRPAAAPLLDLGVAAEAPGYNSVWVGDSLLARPRHEPLTLLAGLATLTRTVTLGTAVLLPAYRNPVVMAHQVATLDQLAQGRLILGVGVAADQRNIRAEFEAAGVPFAQRGARMQEGLELARALWRGESVDWNGRWNMQGAVLGPECHTPDGPPIWGAGSHPAAVRRAGVMFDGWLPIWPDTAEAWAQQLKSVRDHAANAGRTPDSVSASLYATVYVDEDADHATATIDSFLESYYGVPGPTMRKVQACRGGDENAVGEWLTSFFEAGADEIVLRFAGDHKRHLDTFAKIREQFGW